MPGMLLAAASLAAAGMLHGATIRNVTIDHDGTRYRLPSSTSLAAPREAGFRVLTASEQFERISSVFEESRYLPPDEDITTWGADARIDAPAQLPALCQRWGSA